MLDVTLTNTKGVESITLFKGKPYFMLFCDIDSKDPENLLSILKYFQKWHYSVYYYETSKGYHIISPVLLTLRSWLFRIETLKHKIKNYRFGALRISRRKEETNICYFQSWNDRKFKESSSIGKLLTESFYIKNEKLVKPRETELSFICYEQLNYTLKTIDRADNSSGILFPPNTNWLGKSNENLISSVNCPVIGNKTLDFSSIYEASETFDDCEAMQE